MQANALPMSLVFTDPRRGGRLVGKHRAALWGARGEAEGRRTRAGDHVVLLQPDDGGDGVLGVHGPKSALAPRRLAAGVLVRVLIRRAGALPMLPGATWPDHECTP